MEAELLKAKPVLTQFDMMRAVIDNMEAQGQRLFSVEKAVEALGAHEDYRSIKAHAALTGRIHVGAYRSGHGFANFARQKTTLSTIDTMTPSKASFILTLADMIGLLLCSPRYLAARQGWLQRQLGPDAHHALARELMPNRVGCQVNSYKQRPAQIRPISGSFP